MIWRLYAHLRGVSSAAAAAAAAAVTSFVLVSIDTHRDQQLLANWQRSSNTDNESRYCFNFQLPSKFLMKRKDKFIEKIMVASHSLLDYLAI